MEDEVKLPEKRELEHTFVFQSSHVHPISKENSPPDTVFGRFAQKISVIFKRNTPQKSEIKLSGRIRELETIANQVFFELLDFKKDIQTKIDPDLFSLVSTILDPLIKETGRLPPLMEKTDNTAKHVKIFSRYVESIDKAKEWIKLRNKSPQTLEPAIIEQIAKDFVFRIDRDIQVIQDYLSHALASLDMSEALQIELKEKLMPKLSPQVVELNQLKNFPPDFSLQTFMKWRSHADHSREVLFGAALHFIDNFSHEFLPSPKKESENEHLQAIAKQLSELEKKIQTLTTEIEAFIQLDEAQKKGFLAKIELLEIEAHQLNCNLHLSHEDSERMEGVLETLVSLRETFTF